MNGEEDPVTTVEDAADLAAALPANVAGSTLHPGADTASSRKVDRQRAFALVESFLSDLDGVVGAPGECE